jgi:hypothetical protein
MAESSVFDGLVSGLSDEERRSLLDRVRKSVAVSNVPLFDVASLPSSPPLSGKDRLAQLGLFARFILFLRRLFSGRDYDSLLTEDTLKSIARRVGLVSADLVDYRRGILLPGFLNELRHLRDAARFFYDILARSVDQDRAAFVAFLASIEIPAVHERLLRETDPFIWSSFHPDAPEAEIRDAVLGAYEDILAILPDERRRAMYQDLRGLLFLKRLSGFLFERLLSLFKADPGAEGRLSTSFSEARDLLVELGDILFSLSTPPSVELMEALFIFAEHEEIGAAAIDAEALLGGDLARSEEALARIRAFNTAVPLADIIRLVVEDPDHAPRELAGGEDWLNLYRGFWKSRIEAGLSDLHSERRYHEIATEIAEFVGDAELPVFSHISSEERSDCPAVHLELALRFLDAFSRGLFLKDLNRSLRIVLVDGEFYRKENRVEYTDAYNTILRVPEVVASLDERLGPEGEIGRSWSEAKLEIVSLPIKKRKIQSVARGADEEAERIVKDAGAALAELVRVLGGILKGEAGGRYDSLANLSSLDGKANKDFIRGLGTVKDRLEQTYRLLSEISGLDLGGINP